MKELIDTHGHIYEPDFDKDRDEIINRCKEEGIKKIFMPNIDLNTIQSMLDVSKKYPNYCLPMMGLHPCDVDKGYEGVLAEMKKYLTEMPSLRFYAIGEIGLDLYRSSTFFKEQVQAFKVQLGWATELKLPVAIHCRSAFDEMIDVIKEFPNLKGIVHCFSSSLADAKKLIDLGFLLGIGGVITFKNSNLGEVIKSIDLRHIVLETDSPYLAPVPYRGQRNDPSLLTYIAEEIAIIKNISLEEVARCTTYNAEKLFMC